jgi:hypothetical protein
MHQAVAPALGQIDIGDSAVQPMRRVNGEVCGAVELLVAPDMVEFPTIGERLAGLDLEPDNSHCNPPHRDVLDIFIINPRLVLADRG